MKLEILKEQLRGVVPDNILRQLQSINTNSLREIRLRAGKNVVFVTDDKLYKTNSYASKEDVMACVKNASCNSVYAFIDEIKNGFITYKGGHRIGLCGRAVIKGGEVSNIVDFSGVNIRIAKEILGCGKEILELSGGGSTLIISPPGCGKNTILRDLTRLLGENNNVSVVDERGEISASYRGIPQFDMGIMTDILYLCPKVEGIEIVLRGMSPDYIITDEVGRKDIEAVNKGLLSGVKFVLSAHGDNIKDTLSRLEFDRVCDKFSLIVLIGKNGTICDYVRSA